MAKQNEIPVTSFVSPYPENTTKDQQDSWNRSVGNFCKGSQAIKKLDGIYSARAGNIIFIEGFIDVDSDVSIIEVLPVAPRNDGFLNIYDENGDLSGILVTAGSKNLDFIGYSPGQYYIKGQYFAKTERN